MKWFLSAGSSMSVILWSVIPPDELEEDVWEDDFNTGEEQVLEVVSTFSGFLLYGLSQCISDLTMLNQDFLCEVLSINSLQFWASTWFQLNSNSTKHVLRRSTNTTSFVWLSWLSTSNGKSLIFLQLKNKLS